MMTIQNLIIEVTRRCNLKCEHCLRGNAQNKNIDFKYIDSLLSQCDGIGNVAFTGGEPSMNVPAIEYFLNKVKQLNIWIDSFYIATNGINVTEEFVMACLKLYSYSGSKELCEVNVSNDIFHAREGHYNTDLLEGLSFFRKKFDKDNHNYYGMSGLINEGRAKDQIDCGKTLEERAIETKDDLSDTEVVLNCNGQIINGCDWSYKNQGKHILCSVDKLSEYYESLAECVEPRE